MCGHKEKEDFRLSLQQLGVLKKQLRENGLTNDICELYASAKDVLQFYYPDSEPNYITSQQTVGEVYVLEAANGVENLRDKTVLIPSADPGYDWILSHRIKGFITMFGGANSHMAIRAGELSIPAVVGTGAKNFERYRNARMLEIDAGG